MHQDRFALDQQLLECGLLELHRVHFDLAKPRCKLGHAEHRAARLERVRRTLHGRTIVARDRLAQA